MKKLVAIIGLLFAQYAYALDEWHVAVINDPDGFTFIRSGGGKDFMVIDTVQKNAFFYSTGDTSGQWIAVQTPMGNPDLCIVQESFSFMNWIPQNSMN